MPGIILYQNEKGDLHTVSNNAIDKYSIFRLEKEYLEETTIEDLAKKLSPHYGVHPELLQVCYFDAVRSSKGTMIATSYYTSSELTKQLRKAIIDYVSSWIDPDLSLEILKIKKIEEEFGITPEKHKTIMDILKRIR